MGIDFRIFYPRALDKSFEPFELPFLQQLSAASGLFVSIQQIDAKYSAHCSLHSTCPQNNGSNYY